MILFTHLPLEIQERVIFFLLSHRDVAALSVQCRTLSLLCNMSQRRKYRRIYITSSRKSFTSAFNILLDVLKRPSLGEHVRHIEYTEDYWAGHEPNSKQPRRELSGEEMQLLHAATRRAGFVDLEGVRVIDLLLQLMNLDVAKYARRGDLIEGGAYMAQALTTLLISVSPYVESIAIAPPFHHFLNAKMLVDPEEVGFPLYQFLYRDNAYPQESLFLQHLRSVYVINIAKYYKDDGRTYYLLDFTGALALFHRLPSIKSVSVDLLLEDSHRVPVTEIANSNVTKIAIHHSSVDSIYLAALICSCKALREFEYSIGGRSDIFDGISFFNVKTFIQAILIHRKTLEILDVDVEADLDYLFVSDSSKLDYYLDNNGGQDDAECAPYGLTIWEQSGGLGDFHALKHLSLGVCFLMYFARGVNPTHDGSLRLVDCLPENLEYLCVRGYERGENEERDRQFNELIAVQKTGTSKLKTVVGIDAMIPNAEHVDPNHDPHLLWED